MESPVQNYRQKIWPCVILVLLTLALRTPLLGIPFERDEGEYAYIAWRMEHHELPYRDWIDQKPPGIFWVYRTALLLPMDAVSAAHFMALLFAAAAACALYILARRFMADGWALLAGGCSRCSQPTRCCTGRKPIRKCLCCCHWCFPYWRFFPR